MDRTKQLETLLVIVLALVALYLFRSSRWLLLVAMGVGLAGLLISGLADILHRGWTWLSLAMGAVSGKILLTVVYVFLLVPIALIARWLGKTSLRRKPEGDSFFSKRDHTFKKEDFIHPW